MAAHAGDVAVLLTVEAELLHHLGVEAPGYHCAVAGLGVEFLHLFPGLGEVHGGQQLAGAAGDGLFPLEHHPLQVLGEAPGGLAHHAFEIAYHRIGKCQRLPLTDHRLRRQVVLHHEDGQIPHHLGGGGHLHDVPQHLVHVPVHLLHRVKAVAQAQALHLGLQVGVLAAGHLVAVDVGGGVGDAALKAAVAQAHVRPVVAEPLEGAEGKAGVPLLAPEGGGQGVEGGLAGGGHGLHRAVHHVYPRLGGHEAGGHLVAGGVVGVEVDGNAHLLLQGLHQGLGGVRLQ